MFVFWKQFWTGCWNQMSDVPKICSSDGTEHFEQICNQLLAIFIDINNYYPNTNYIQIAGLKSGGRLRLLLCIISKWNFNTKNQNDLEIFWLRIHWPTHTRANLHEWNSKWTVIRMKMDRLKQNQTVICIKVDGPVQGVRRLALNSTSSFVFSTTSQKENYSKHLLHLSSPLLEWLMHYRIYTYHVILWPLFTDIKTSLMFQVLFFNLHLGLSLWNSRGVYCILGFWNSIKIDLADYQE